MTRDELMICPNCVRGNLPGAETCSNCEQSLTALDQPIPHSRVEKSLMEEAVSGLAQHAPVTVRPATTVREAIALMLAQNIGSLLVVDVTGALVGIFSERDLLIKIADSYDSCAD